jgi:hypothetical protein
LTVKEQGFERWIYPTDIDVREGFGHEPDFYINEADPESALDLAKTKLIELGKWLSSDPLSIPP